MLIIEVKLKRYLKEYSYLPVADPGEGPGPAPPPLFLDQTEARKAEKIIFLGLAPPLNPNPNPVCLFLNILLLSFSLFGCGLNSS